VAEKVASQEEFDVEHPVELNVFKEQVEHFWTVSAVDVAKASLFFKLRG